MRKFTFLGVIRETILSFWGLGQKQLIIVTFLLN